MNGSKDYSGLNEPPTQGSWYIGMLAGLTVTIDSTSVNLGTLSPSNTWTATGTNAVGITTSASNGYIITAWVADNMTHVNFPTVQINHWSGANTTPTEWGTDCPDDSNYCAFGYTTDDGTLGTVNPDRFTTDCTPTPCYAGFGEAGPGDPVGDYTSPTSTATTTITYKISVDTLQTAGRYQTTVIYIATANY